LTEEGNHASFFAMLLLLALVLLLGIYPVLLVQPAYKIVAVSFPIPDAVFIRQSMVFTLGRASVAVGFMVALAVGIFFLRRFLLKRRSVAEAPTWACAATTEACRVGYTAGSYSGEFAALTRPLNGSKRRMEPLGEGEIFPPQRKFSSTNHDVFRTKIRPYVKRISVQMNRLAIFQTGRVHHYILYALLFMILIFLMTYFGFI
jgi:hypothetical protein